MEKEWLEGHASYGWKTAHKKVGYVGLWSFESAALAKILALNDEKLKSSSHYPYDLAHYKSNKRFSVKAIETVELSCHVPYPADTPVYVYSYRSVDR